MEDIFEIIKNKADKMENLSEGNVKVLLIFNRFLNHVGYDTDNFIFEDNYCNRHIDISSHFVNENGLIVVEAKALKYENKDLEITYRDKKQLIDYLNGRKEKTVWGILSNGIEYYLFNNDIPGSVEDKIVCHISVNKKTDLRYLPLFSYENLFVNKTSSFFADIARFKKHWKEKGYKNSSYEMYRSTLNGFFEFYSQTHRYFSFGKVDKECLSDITINDFTAYLSNKDANNSKRKKKMSPITFRNNYRHIKAFFDILMEKGYIYRHNFTCSEKEVLDSFEKKNQIQYTYSLDADEYQILLEHLYKGRNGLRNIAVFMLCSSYGLKRSEIIKLTWDSIDFNKNIIKVNGCKHKMTELMRYCIQHLHDERKRQRLKCNEVFTNNQPKGGKGLSEGAINDIFYSLRTIDAPTHNFQWLCPEKARECLVRSMFECGYSLEQIVFYTGIDLQSVTRCIPYETVIAVGEKRFEKQNKKPVHPFQNAIDKFYQQITGSTS